MNTTLRCFMVNTIWMHISTIYLGQSSLVVRILRLSDSFLCFLDEVCRLVHHVASMVDDGILELAVTAGRRDAADGARQHTQCVCGIACRNPSVVLIALSQSPATKGKKKVKVGFLWSATYTVNHLDQLRFTILEVAVDWQEPMVLQCKLWPSIARVNVQLDPRHAASKHTTAPINHTRPSPRKHSPDGAARARKQTSDYNLLLSLSNSKG